MRERRAALLPLAGDSVAAPIVEYVVVHELVHLHEGYHTPEFWARVERAMVDFARRKSWLAEHATDVSVLSHRGLQEP